MFITPEWFDFLMYLLRPAALWGRAIRTWFIAHNADWQWVILGLSLVFIGAGIIGKPKSRIAFVAVITGIASALMAQSWVFMGEVRKSVLLYFISFLLGLLASRKINLKPGFSPGLPRSLVIIVLVMSVVTGAALRFYYMDREPLTNYELMAVVDAYKLGDLDFQKGKLWYIHFGTMAESHDSLFYKSYLLLIRAFAGDTIYLAHIGAIIAGLLTVIVFFYFLRMILPETVALVSCFFLAISRFHVSISRNGAFISFTLLFVLICYYFLFRFYRYKKWRDLLIAGVLSTFAGHFYVAGRVVPFIVLAFLFLFGMEKSNRSWGKYWKKIAVIVPVMIVSFYLANLGTRPWDVYYFGPKRDQGIIPILMNSDEVYKPQPYSEKIAVSLKLVRLHAEHALTTFFGDSRSFGFRFPNHISFPVTIFFSVLSIFALGILTGNITYIPAIFMVFLFFLGMVPNIISSHFVARRMIMAIPSLIVFSAIGVYAFIHVTHGIFRMRIPRVMFNAVIYAVVAGACIVILLLNTAILHPARLQEPHVTSPDMILALKLTSLIDRYDIVCPILHGSKSLAYIMSHNQLKKKGLKFDECIISAHILSTQIPCMRLKPGRGITYLVKDPHYAAAAARILRQMYPGLEIFPLNDARKHLIATFLTVPEEDLLNAKKLEWSFYRNSSMNDPVPVTFISDTLNPDNQKLPVRAPFNGIVEGSLRITVASRYRFGVQDDDTTELFVNNRKIEPAGENNEEENPGDYLYLVPGIYPFKIVFRNHTGHLNPKLLYTRWWGALEPVPTQWIFSRTFSDIEETRGPPVKIVTEMETLFTRTEYHPQTRWLRYGYDNYLYVIGGDKNELTVKKYDLDFNLVAEMPTGGLHAMENPTHVATDNTGGIYVTNQGCIYKFSIRGDFLGKRLVPGSRNIACDHEGNVYALDYRTHAVLKFDKYLKPVMSWGKYGFDDGEFVDPVNLYISTDDSMYVLDATGRIQQFDLSGIYIRKWRMKYPFYRGYESGLCVDKNGNIITLFGADARILDKDGNYLITKHAQIPVSERIPFFSSIEVVGDNLYFSAFAQFPHTKVMDLRTMLPDEELKKKP